MHVFDLRRDCIALGDRPAGQHEVGERGARHGAFVGNDPADPAGTDDKHASHLASSRARKQADLIQVEPRNPVEVLH
jgi:hypothetical protein